MDAVSVIDDVFRHLSLTILALMNTVSVIDDMFRHLSLTILDGCSKCD
jgi:predicted acyltransferase